MNVKNCLKILVVSSLMLGVTAFALTRPGIESRFLIQNNTNYTLRYQLQNGDVTELCISRNQSACGLYDAANLAPNQTVEFSLSPKTARGPQPIRVPVELYLSHGNKKLCHISLLTNILSNVNLTINPPVKKHCKNDLVSVSIVKAEPIRIIIN